MAVSQAPVARSTWNAWIGKYAPGMALAVGIGLLAWVIQTLEEGLIGHAIIEALVVAILIGMIVRTLWKPGARWAPGISFTGKQVLEAAIVLLGASVSLPVLLKAGPVLVLAIVLAVVVGIVQPVHWARAGAESQAGDPGRLR